MKCPKGISYEADFCLTRPATIWAARMGAEAIGTASEKPRPLLRSGRGFASGAGRRENNYFRRLLVNKIGGICPAVSRGSFVKICQTVDLQGFHNFNTVFHSLCKLRPPPFSPPGRLHKNLFP